MEKLSISVQITAEGEGLSLPKYATPGSAGMDLYAAVGEDVILAPGEVRLISTGIRIAIPVGFEGQIRPRSGLALRNGITMLNSPGTIDSDYRGTVAVIAINHGKEPFTVRRGERIAQLVICPVARAEWELVGDLDDTQRGTGGFGHSGV